MGGKKQGKSQQSQKPIDKNVGNLMRNNQSTLNQIFQSSSDSHQQENQQGNRQGNRQKSGQKKQKTKGAKDLPPRILIKFLDYLRRMKKISEQEYGSIKKRGANLMVLEQIFQNRSFRPSIAEYLKSHQFKRDIQISKKRLNTNDQSPRNSQKNLLKLQTFITFSFLQGSIKNFSSLSKPIHEDSLYQNRSMEAQEVYQMNPLYLPQPMVFDLESLPQLKNNQDFYNQFLRQDQISHPQPAIFDLESPLLDNECFWSQNENESKMNENQRMCETHNIRNKRDKGLLQSSFTILDAGEISEQSEFLL